jgi:hypothetical protein
VLQRALARELAAKVLLVVRQDFTEGDRFAGLEARSLHELIE